MIVSPLKNSAERFSRERRKSRPGMTRFLLLVLAYFSFPAFGAFTPTRLLKVEIVSNAPAFSSGGYDVSQLIDGDLETEYASENCGTNTFVEFDFGTPETVIAFRHVDRADRALVGESELIFSNENGDVLEKFAVKHEDRKSGETFFVLPKPVHARRVTWRVAKMGVNQIGTVGGAEVGFYSAGNPETAPTLDSVKARGLPFVDRHEQQPVQVCITHPYLESIDATLRVGDAKTQVVRLHHGQNLITCQLPAVETNTERRVQVELAPGLVRTMEFVQSPVRPMTIYILPHSHTDIGYTEIQTAIEQKQINNLVRGIELARRTAAYPAGARFVWNVEALWAADLYLQRLGPQARADLFEAVKAGQVSLNGMYLNELTALCRPEELIQLFRYSTQLAREIGKPIEAAMISDVPGYTWGTVTAMAQAGIRYFSAGPNYGEREFMKLWENKPFYWIGPDGKSKVLVWIPFQGYALSHIYETMSPKLLDDLCSRLQKPEQPYEIAYIRWAGHGDNAVPDPEICDFVKDWNAEHLSPQFIISGTADAFRALEKRYAKQLPEYRGDWTPYWEDGAGSTAHETAMNRQSSERLTQAQALFAMFGRNRNSKSSIRGQTETLTPALSHPKGEGEFAFPSGRFENAWRNVLLFSEHTWGASDSISSPRGQRAMEQWAIKKSYADQADQQSRELIAEALKLRISGNSFPKNSEVEVINTLSWARTELVSVSPEMSREGNFVTDRAGNSVLSQRLESGELVFLARDVPPFATARYHISKNAGFQSVAQSDSQATFNSLPPPRSAGRGDSELNASSPPDSLGGEGAVSRVDILESNALLALVSSRTSQSGVRVHDTVLENDRLRVRVDPVTGGIVELRMKGSSENFAGESADEQLNTFLYFRGSDPHHAQTNGPVTISVGENGPLVASLTIESSAPGCRSLRRELRLMAGGDYVEIFNHVDKERLEVADYRLPSGKESLNFGFPFNLTHAEVSIDIPLAVMQPDRDQLPGSCKGWFTVGRWVNIANEHAGLTWVTLDAPLVRFNDPAEDMREWRSDLSKNLKGAHKLYSWVMNNRWGTNYKADQEGPTTFRYILRPQQSNDPAEATRFAAGFSQPLIVAAAQSNSSERKNISIPLLQLDSPDVIVSSLKPSDDHRAWIIRLFGASGKDRTVKLEWGARQPKRVTFSDTSEIPKSEAGERIEVPGLGLVTLRADFE